MRRLRLRVAMTPTGAAVAIAAGIAAAGWLADGDSWVFAAVAAAAAIAGIATRRAALAWPAVVAFGLWRGLAAMAVPDVPAGVTIDDRTEDRVEGVVGGPVVPGAGITGAP